MFKKISLLLLSIVTLHAEPSIKQLSETPSIFLLSDFLSEKECDHMIKISKPNMVPSKVVDDDKAGAVLDKRRSSKGFFVPKKWKDPISMRIEKRIADLTNMPVENGENLHVLCYQVGGEFKPHFDFFNTETAGGKDCLKAGGQRYATVVMYLNTPEAGGETIFPEANIAITPKKGDAVLFYNLYDDGTVDPHSLHGGVPVIAGEKWIMTKWIRENPYYYQ